MSCGNHSKELNLAGEYKHLLSKIRPLIQELDKSKDAQMCLLWLSRLDQCSRDEEYERNEILSELSRQVKNKRLQPPFNSQPPEGPLKRMSLKNPIQLRRSNDFSDGISSGLTTELSPSSASSSSSEFSGDGNQSPIHSQSRKCLNKVGCLRSMRESKDGHSKCLSLQQKYRERVVNDHMIIGRYQDIIKSLIMRNLKSDGSLNKRSPKAFEDCNIGDLTTLLQMIEQENDNLKNKTQLEGVSSEKLLELESKNSELNGRVRDLEVENSMLEMKCKELEREKEDLLGKCRSSDTKIQEAEKHLRTVELKYEESFRACEVEHQAVMTELEKKYACELATMERILEEKHNEIASLKEQISSQCLQYESELLRLKHNLIQNPELEKEKRKVKFLKSKIKKLEKRAETMAITFQSQLEQMAAKKDLLISTLELKLNSRDADSVTKDFHDSFINEKVSNLETQYRKLLEESEHQAAQRRKVDLQKIQVLEKQLVDYGVGVNDLSPNTRTENISLPGPQESDDKK